MVVDDRPWAVVYFWGEEPLTGPGSIGEIASDGNHATLAARSRLASRPIHPWGIVPRQSVVARKNRDVDQT